jgi:hypothetical protein
MSDMTISIDTWNDLLINIQREELLTEIKNLIKSGKKVCVTDEKDQIIGGIILDQGNCILIPIA